MAHAHLFKITRYEEFIGKGVCECGAVKFEATEWPGGEGPMSPGSRTSSARTALLRRIEHLNRTEGKEGDPSMISIKDIGTEGVERLADHNKPEVIAEARAALAGPAPQPPKEEGGPDPVARGLDKWHKHKYLEASKEEIIAYYHAHGFKATCIRFDSPSSTISHLFRKWGVKTKQRGGPQKKETVDVVDRVLEIERQRVRAELLELAKKIEALSPYADALDNLAAVRKKISEQER